MEDLMVINGIEIEDTKLLSCRGQTLLYDEKYVGTYILSNGNGYITWLDGKSQMRCKWPDSWSSSLEYVLKEPLLGREMGRARLGTLADRTALRFNW
jgi:hypothetical protein